MIDSKEKWYDWKEDNKTVYIDEGQLDKLNKEGELKNKDGTFKIKVVKARD